MHSIINKSWNIDFINRKKNYIQMIFKYTHQNLICKHHCIIFFFPYLCEFLIIQKKSFDVCERWQEYYYHVELLYYNNNLFQVFTYIPTHAKALGFFLPCGVRVNEFDFHLRDAGGYYLVNLNWRCWEKITKQDLYLCIHCIGFYEVVKNLIHISLYKIDSHECADKVRYIFPIQQIEIIYVAETVCVQCIFEKCLRSRHRVHSICKEKVHTVL